MGIIDNGDNEWGVEGTSCASIDECLIVQLRVFSNSIYKTRNVHNL